MIDLLMASVLAHAPMDASAMNARSDETVVVMSTTMETFRFAADAPKKHQPYNSETR